ncbi:MAG: hypothetical protein M3R44_00735 [Candidatus Eremiobacteraeota bacterium]|nr:hypothetical protein [Candidatus Eremiobacteraeota bacterium]
MKAVSGKVGQTLFDGTIRLKVLEVRDATDSEIADAERTGILVATDKKAMVISVLIHNGLSKNFQEILTYTLADKDEIAFEVGAPNVKPNPLDMLQGAAVKQHAVFVVDKTFTPVKLIVTCPTCNQAVHFRDFRVAIPSMPSPGAP